MPEATLVTFNTHYGLRSLRERCAPYDLLSALDLLGEPDVLVIQEVWTPDGRHGVVEEFAARRGYEVLGLVFCRATLDARWPRPDAAGEGTVGLAVLTRLPGRIVATPKIGPSLYDPIRDRRVLHTEVDVGGSRVSLVGIHLTSRLPYGPPRQLRRLARVLPREGAAIVAGDCNLWGPPVAALLPGWRRAVKGRTWPAAHPHSQIDHILVRGPVEVIEGSVLANLGSDHRPVRVRLRVG
jgi:endonuclease/exonuclease/phosphatase family metal-dependent hydrolase